jgi:hypothetical protein
LNSPHGGGGKTYLTGVDPALTATVAEPGENHSVWKRLVVATAVKLGVPAHDVIDEPGAQVDQVLSCGIGA